MGHPLAEVLPECGAEFTGPTGIKWRCWRGRHGPGPKIVVRMVYGHETEYHIPDGHWYRAVPGQVENPEPEQ